MTPTSFPVTPAQPNLKAYTLSALNLFQQFSRATYLQKFGVQAPPFDPTYPVKSWFDTSKRPSGIANYLVIHSVGNSATVQKMALLLAQAMDINLNGDYVYPAYTPSPTTPATIQGGSGLDPTLLCLLSDAVLLAESLWGQSAAPTPTLAPDESPISWNGELRRVWQVDAPNGGNYNCEVLLLNMWQHGIGAPGSWDLSNVANPVWVPAPAPDQFAKGVVPVPVRALKPNEVFQAGPAGIGVEIVRTDI